MQNKQEFSLCFSSTQCVFVDPTEVPAYVACRDGSQLGLERALSVYRCDDRLAHLKKQFVKETLEAGKSGWTCCVGHIWSILCDQLHTP